MNQSFEFKGIVDTIINNFMQVMSIKPFQPRINDFLRKEFTRAMSKVETELKPNINFEPSESEISFLNDYVFQNLQGHADQIGNQLRQELQRGMLNGETPAQIKERVKTVFADTTYSNRLKTVMRTEKLRASNAGAYAGAQQATDAGIVLKKYMDVTMDNRTSNICKKENSKYGSKEKAIPLDEEFTVTVDNKTYRGQYPPWHINCRTVIRFVREDI